MSSSTSYRRIARKPLPTSTAVALPANQEVRSHNHRPVSSVVSALSDDEETGPFPHGEAVVLTPEPRPEPVVPLQNHEKPSKPKRAPRRLSAIFCFAGPWSLEIWSVLLAWLSFAAIVVVLAYYNHKPQGFWPYKSLTLNGLLALLASISRASLAVVIAASISQGKWNWFVGRSKQGVRALNRQKLSDFELFDDASRGAWGSLMLLWKRFGHLVSVGAIITILLLGFDTFAQQIIAIYEQYDIVPSSDQSLVPRSEWLDGSHFFTTTTSGTLVSDLAVKSAVYLGIVNQNLTDPTLICPTGNCTWPITPTVAVCGTCVDLTPNITQTCESEGCNYTLPTGEKLDGRTITIPLSEYDRKRKLFQLWTPFPPQPYSRKWTQQIPEVPTYISVARSIGVPYLETNMSVVKAAECALFLCLQAHNVSVINGKASSKILVNHTSATANDAFDYNFTSIPYDDLNIPKSHPGYGAVKPSLEAMADTVGMYTLGDVQTLRQSSGGADLSEMWSANVSSDTIQAFWSASASIDSYTGLIQNIAKSLSNTIRLTSPAPASEGSRYIGTARGPKAYIRIRWAWIAYPALMVVISPLFLLLTILQTKRKGVNVWKSSATAVLLSSVYDEGGNILTLDDRQSRDARALNDALADVKMEVHAADNMQQSGRSSGLWTFALHRS